MTTTEPVPGDSTSDEPVKPGVFERLYDKVAEDIDQKIGWYRLPKPLGLLDLIGIRNVLRERNLYDTSRLPAVDPVQPPPYDPAYRTQRTSDGSWNDLEH